MTAIDAEAFLRDLHEVRQIGRFEGRRASADLRAAGHGIAPLAGPADPAARPRGTAGRTVGVTLGLVVLTAVVGFE